MERCYWNYLRVYVPSASELIDASPHPISGSEVLGGHPHPAQVTVGPPELERNVFGTFLLLHPSEAMATSFEYVLPMEILRTEGAEVEYRVLVQKQPGTRAIPLQFELLLPSGVDLEMSEPEPTLATTSRLKYSLLLETDQTLTVVFTRP